MEDAAAGERARKTIPSRVFNALLRWSFGLDLRDSNSGFRVMRRAVAQSLHLYGDMYRFIPQLAFSKGFLVAEEGVSHRRRKYGESKYGPRRFWTGLLDLLTLRFITRFSQRPLHFLGTIGLSSLDPRDRTGGLRACLQADRRKLPDPHRRRSSSG